MDSKNEEKYNEKKTKKNAELLKRKRKITSKEKEINIKDSKHTDNNNKSHDNEKNEPVSPENNNLDKVEDSSKNKHPEQNNNSELNNINEIKNLEITNNNSSSLFTGNDIYLNYLPMTNNYSKSYLHKDIIDNIICTNKTNFIFTFSYDGVIKFWKKMVEGIEYVKKFKAHPNKITGISINCNGNLLCTCSYKDLSIKIFDITNFDLFDFIQLDFYPMLIEFITENSSLINLVALSEKDKGLIHIYDITHKKEISLLNLHNNSLITNIKFNSKYNICLSTSNLGLIEYWCKFETIKNEENIINFDFPKNHIKFKYKSETDLFKLYNKDKKNNILSLSLSPKNNYFGLYTKSKIIYIFDFLTAKILYTIPDKCELTESKNELIEKDIDKYLDTLYQPNIQFDESEKYIYYPSKEGIKLLQLLNNNKTDLIYIIGKKEKLRFINICLFQGESLKNKNSLIQTNLNSNISFHEEKILDPLLFACAYRNNRFYIFTKKEPDNKLKRDIINEDIDELKNKNSNKNKKQENNELPEKAVIETSKGEIFVKLFYKECPKTVKNFVTLAKRGYYDGLIFHRIIKNFMIQTGDPKGNGTGGESIYGNPFKDEFNANLLHEEFTLSMANAGPDTNGSQFFITTVPCHWLDGKHTVFGRVYEGKDVVKLIEEEECDRNNKPLNDVIMNTVKVINK